jgi:colanic acid biosynthesis glycosyl transferase WcaI
LRLFAWAVFHVVSTVAAIRYADRPEVIFAPSPPLTMGVNAWVIGRLKRCPFVYNVQEIYPDLAISLGALRNKTAIRLAFWLERFVYRRAAVITVIAPRMRQRLIDKDVADDRLEVIPNSVDLAEMRLEPRDNAFAREHGLLGKFVISYAGNLGPAQGLETVLEAAAMIRSVEDILIVFIGGGILYDKLRSTITELQLTNVLILPHQPYARVPQIYASSDICLVTQAAGTGSEAIPSKVYRIMACGRPIIATADSGSDLARVIHDAGCGQVVEPGDTAGLASLMRQAFEQAAEWAAWGAAGRRHVERHYSRSRTSARYDELIRQLTGKP